MVADDAPRPRPRPTPVAAGTRSTDSDPRPAASADVQPLADQQPSAAEQTTDSSAGKRGSRLTGLRGGKTGKSDKADKSKAGPHKAERAGKPQKTGRTAVAAPRATIGRELARTEPSQPAQVVVAAGSAVVTAARVGRLLGRSYWRMAKQLPGVGTGVTVVEAQAQRLRQAAASEFARLLEMPQHLSGGGATPEEQRVMMLVHNSGSDPEPLRSAMTELLERSTEADSEQSREYLFGSIVSQLVPDEARILAALATGRTYAAVDVLSKPNGRSGRNRVVLANTSTIGAGAGISEPSGVGTYLSRLQGFGLVDFTYSPHHLDAQFESLLRDPGVAAARASIEAGRQGSAKIVRKAVTLSPLGREFWAACAPSKTRLSRRSS